MYNIKDTVFYGKCTKQKPNNSVRQLQLIFLWDLMRPQLFCGEMTYYARSQKMRYFVDFALDSESV